MPQAQGATGAGAYPKLAKDTALSSWQYMALTILNGRGAMPAFATPASASTGPRAPFLTDEQIADVINYVRSHFGNHYRDVVTPDKIATLPHTGVAPMEE